MSLAQFKIYFVRPTLLKDLAILGMNRAEQSDRNLLERFAKE